MQAQEKLAARSWEGPRLMFPNMRGGVHRRNSVTGIFRRYLEEAELPRIRFHDLRHTAAVMMLNSGVPVNVVSQILGHKDSAMTLRRYAHVISGAQQIAADRIDGYGF
jgi:integrase